MINSIECPGVFISSDTLKLILDDLDTVLSCVDSYPGSSADNLFEWSRVFRKFIV